MHPCKPFKKRLLASCVSAAITTSLPGLVHSQDGVFEEVVVTGVRSAQATAVNIKRDADSIVDAISAEDIGKLPDVTITDSLQRISGVQIRRDAGEGGSVNIRGMGQVLTMLNGESYLGANSITSVQPNYSDIPSQLFSGATVMKSQTATNHPGGISGAVDLHTYRPLSSGFDQGFTFSGAAQVSQGKETGKTDPSLNFLVNWRDERMGFMVSLAHQESNLANFYSGMNGDSGWTGFAAESWAYDWVDEDTQLGGLGDRMGPDSSVDVNNNNRFDDTYWAYQGHSAFNRQTERQRTGINAAFQIEVAGGLEFVAEVFHTQMEDYDRKMGLSHTDKWNRWGWFYPTQRNNTGLQVDGANLYTVQEYTGNGMRVKSFSEVFTHQAESTNLNLELNYDNGGPLTGSARYVHGTAEMERLNSYMDIDVAAGNQWGVQCRNYPAGTAGQRGDCPMGQLQTNPGGYLGFPVLTVNYGDNNPHWSGFDNNANLTRGGQPMAGAPERSIGDYLADVNAYSIGALTSENNYLREGQLDVFRLDGSYEFQHDWLKSVDFGLRHSARSVDNFEFDLLSPIGGCDVKWKATDVALNGGDIEGACTYGPDNNYFTAGVPRPIANLNPIQVSNYGSTTGIPSV